MNKPEYIVVDELGTVVTDVKTRLGLPELNYQYGYVRELNETLTQWEANPTDAVKRFPLVWAEQPFNVVRGISAAFFGRIDLLRLFVMNSTDKTWKAYERMENNFKPVIHPIVRGLLDNIDLSLAFHTQGVERIECVTQDIYYWGNAQESVLNNPVDCTIITIRNLMIANNPNCTPVSSM